MEDNKNLDYSTYQKYYPMKVGQLFTTSTDFLKDVKVGDKILCTNLEIINKTDMIHKESYRIQINEGVNKGKILTLIDEKYDYGILNPNLGDCTNEDPIEIEIVSIKDKEIKYKINNLDYIIIE